MEEIPLGFGHNMAYILFAKMEEKTTLLDYGDARGFHVAKGVLAALLDRLREDKQQHGERKLLHDVNNEELELASPPGFLHVTSYPETRVSFFFLYSFAPLSSCRELLLLWLPEGFAGHLGHRKRDREPRGNF